ncbi:hypothetical protein HZ996_04940 [Cryomorphaceae bacterium]|nr:hypothetical protein HZ996_04940 [Cryomorphaceae bacterium]
MKLRLLICMLASAALTYAQRADSFDQRVRQTHLNPTGETGMEPLSDPNDSYFRSLAYFLQGDFSRSNQWLDSVALHGPMSDEHISRYYLLRGRVNRLVGDNLGAVTMFDSALIVSQRNQSDADIFRVYVDLLEHCRALIMFEEGEVYKDQLNKLANNSRIPPDLLARYMHRKAAYLIEAIDSTDIIPGLLQKCMAYCQVHDLPWHEATAAQDYGYTLHYRKAPGSLTYYERAEAIWSELGYRRDLSQVRFNIARAYSDEGRYQEALDKLEVVLRDAVSYGWKVPEADVWRIRSEVYQKQGNPNEALEAYRVYHDRYTHILADRIDDQVAEMMAKIGAQTTRNDLLRTENAMLTTQEKLEAESNRRQLFLLLTVSLAIILGSLYVFYQRSRQANTMLRSQQEVIESTNRKLEMTLDQKNHLYRELHHRVKNNLTTLSGLLYMQSRNLDSEEAKKALSEARGRIQSMSLIHQGLYQRDDEVQVKLSTYLEELLPNLLSSFSSESQGVDWSIDCDDIELEIEKAMSLAMIVNELVTNSFKYAFKDVINGELRVTGKKLHPGWMVSVQDNGPGMPAGYDWNSSKSLGLRLVKILVEEMGAQFSYTYLDQRARFSIVFEGEEDEA